jgi:Trypsin-co-occurring domain 1
MPPKVVTYALDDSTNVRFEIDPPAGFQEAGTDKVIGKVQDALAPAIDTAKLVLDKLKEAKPGEVTVTFGLKVSGKLDWFIARAGTEGNFQITLTWQSDNRDQGADQS